MNQLLSQFNKNTQTLFTFIESIEPKTSSMKPANGGWSLVECLEHIFITEKGIYKLLNLPGMFSSTPVAEAEKFTLYRENKFTAPAYTEPRGRFSSIDELLSAYKLLRDQFAEYIQNELPKAGNETSPHPIIGPLTKKLWVEFAIDHVERHLRQMEGLMRLDY